MELNVLTVVTNQKRLGHRPKENNMTPEEDKIFGAFTERPLAPLKGVPTYDYVTNLNIYLNSCLSAVDCTLGCGTLVYLMLTAHTDVFNTHCWTDLVHHQQIRSFDQSCLTQLQRLQFCPNSPEPTINFFCLFNKYHAVDRACKKVIRKFIPEKYYKSLSSRIICFAKVISLQILTHLITEYAELEEEDTQEINRKMKEPILGKTIFEDFVEQIDWSQEAVAVKNPYTPAQIISMAYSNIEKCGLYQDDCQEWSRKPRLKNTWSNFKAHFARTFKETQISSRTSKTDGYAANVHAAQANVVLFTKMHQEHTLALENIATAAQTDIT